MDSQLSATKLNCTQCGGELHPDEGQIFLTCPYCSNTVYLDKSKVVFHWYLAPTLDETKAQASLYQWMAGNKTVKDLDKKTSVVSRSFEFFPVWYFKKQSQDGREAITIEPAAATSVTELGQMKLLAGDLRKYDDSISAQAHQPTVPLESALRWMEEQGSANGKVLEQALVHIPLYTFKYTYRGQTYTALVEAATGAVFANIYPAKAETPYMTAGVVTAGVFLCLATFPLIGYLIDSSTGLMAGFGICAGAGLIAAPLLFAFAGWVAAKV
ncbi:MAG: hypothetical protein EHM41_20560 [Chloroflexi bacterium]|nr:MAG: hypothetical protein EHM41_20560 [Chloroflexota bacterium]